MLIVLIGNPGGSAMEGVLDRLIAVIVGCAVALAISFAFDLVWERADSNSAENLGGEG